VPFRAAARTHDAGDPCQLTYLSQSNPMDNSSTTPNG
jgi:hypothetical protein